MRVLLIEDDNSTAQSIELMLKSESFNVFTTDLGAEGSDLGKLYDYEIILLDLNLPDMSARFRRGPLPAIFGQVSVGRPLEYAHSVMSLRGCLDAQRGCADASGKLQSNTLCQNRESAGRPPYAGVTSSSAALRAASFRMRPTTTPPREESSLATVTEVGRRNTTHEPVM